MKMKSMVLLAVAAGCGLVAMLGVQQVLSGGNKPDSDSNHVKVLIATAEIAPGIPLDKTNVAFQDWPKDNIPPGAITKEEQYAERALRTRAFAGQPILEPQLGEKGVFNVSVEIPEGMRVVTVAVNLTMIHSGLMRPGDRVDVLVTYKVNKPRIGQVQKTKTVLEFIQVFATDNLRVGSDPETTEVQAKNISLLVSPEQAALLAHAEKLGTLHLSLRNKTDDEPVKPADVDDAQLENLSPLFVEEPMERQPTPPVQPPEPKQTFTDYVTNGAPAPQLEAEPAKKTWKVRIFVGEEERVQEIELPDEPADQLAEAGTGSGASGSPLFNTLQQMFGGRTGAASSSKDATGGAETAGVGAAPATQPE